MKCSLFGENMKKWMLQNVKEFTKMLHFCSKCSIFARNESSKILPFLTKSHIFGEKESSIFHFNLQFFTKILHFSSEICHFWPKSTIFHSKTANLGLFWAKIKDFTPNPGRSLDHPGRSCIKVTLFQDSRVYKSNFTCVRSRNFYYWGLGILKHR